MKKLRQFVRSSGIWSMVDQGIVSMGNFLLTVILARHMAKTEYGVYVVTLGALLFANAFHSSLIAYPVSVLGAHMGNQEIGRFAGNGVLVTYMFALPVAAVLGATTWVLSGHTDLYLFVVGALLCWQTHETIRRCLMSKLRHRATVLGDSVAYMGQIALVFFFIYRHVQMQAQVGFLAIMLASLAGAIVHSIVIGLRTPRFSATIKLARESMHLGKWPLLSNLGYTGTVYLFPWGLAYRDLGEAATYQAMMNVVQVVNPVMYSIGNVVVPSVAHEMLKPEHERRPRAVATTYMAQGFAILAPIMIAIMLFPARVAAVLYGGQSTYIEHASLLRILPFGALLMYAGHVLMTYFLGKQRVRVVAKSQFAASLVAVGCAIVLIPLWGMTGAAWSFAALGAARIAWLLVNRTHRESAPRVFVNAPPMPESSELR